MGYRTYIGTIPKREYNRIKSLPIEQVLAHYGQPVDGHVGPYEICKQLYEFGKYTDFVPPKGSMKNFFKNKDTRDRYTDYDFYTVSKEFLAYIIENYRLKICAFYNEMLEGVDRNDRATWTPEKFATLYMHVNSMSTEWNYLTPFDLDNGEAITKSWKYEYGIFELVRIYKSFDWKRNIMVFYGY